jgi:hypothetical protein
MGFLGRVSLDLKYSQPNRRRIERGTLSGLANFASATGLQIENPALKNRLSLFQLWSIDPNDVIYDNPFFRRRTADAGSAI